MDGGAVSAVSNRNTTAQAWRHWDDPLMSESRSRRLAELILLHHKPGCAPKAAPCRCWRCHTRCLVPAKRWSSGAQTHRRLHLLSSPMRSGQSEKKGMFVCIDFFLVVVLCKAQWTFLAYSLRGGSWKRDWNESHFIAYVQCSQVVLLFFTDIKNPMWLISSYIVCEFYLT